ncbi:TetR/AcrR family transcriptional regulator [Streptomyces sp. TRM 70361]|uniref:TetR/AcrR family transcriptional regulator n=1 Tax=Streptomyces sp. TRM 70361 TaxID=3116553 RepID=UPI002E7B9F86|nr:TetR/AcrR family transcriptional regulator [Streptomyces sp. TRM 70361]MEE1939910.1 TetR/AcrR family transcriptional regulator [Streptomyces sp. TRM 70361]
MTGTEAGLGTVVGPGRGRPRSAAVDRAIVDAVLRLLERGSGVDALSMEGIAREAGVGKATVYRRWPGKDALLLDVMRALDEPLTELPGKSVRDDLVEVLERLRRRGLAKRDSALLRTMMGHFHSHPRLWQAYHDTVVRARHEQLYAVLRRGMERGEIRSDLEVELLGDLFLGPMLARAMLRTGPGGKRGGKDELPEGLAERIVDGILEGARPRG